MKSLLSDENTCASAVLYAAEKLLGPGVFLWEPQTIWLELKHQGIDLPVSNREKLMAARNLVTTGRFWYDASVFEKTCTAFNDEESQFEGVEDVPVMCLDWAVWEAHEIAKHYSILETAEFDRECTSYCSIQLYRENFVIAPEQLTWVQDSLDRHYPKEVTKLQKIVKDGWAAAPRSSEKLRNAAFPETPEGVQVAHLAAVQHYFNLRKEQYIKDHSSL